MQQRLMKHSIRHVGHLQHVVVDLQRCPEAMDLARSVVQFPGNRIQVVLCELRKVGSLRQILTQEPFGALI